MEKYRVRTNEEIGQYLAELIDRKGISMRQFGKACLQCRGEDDSNETAINNMANRLTQIKKGKKGVQLEDLPIFSHLLNVSAEEILTAGRYFAPCKNRFTNYDFAASRDPSLWEEYINREDKIILNRDEYGKTIIDYALEFGNYGLLKYLTDQKYIWFIGVNPQEYTYTFGAGTRMEPNPLDRIDILDAQLKTRDDLRIRMIRLAIEHHDTAMLDTLHAREVPSLYMSGLCGYKMLEEYDRYDEQLIETIASADEKTMAYFTEDFTIETTYNQRQMTFVFPYIRELVEFMMKSCPSGKLDAVLARCEAHNRKAYEEVRRIQEEVENFYISCMDIDAVEARDMTRKEFRERDLQFDQLHGILTIRTTNPFHVFTTNLVEIREKSADPERQSRIDGINRLLYQMIQGDM